MDHMVKATIRPRLTAEEAEYIVSHLPPPTTRVGFSVMAKLLSEDDDLEPAPAPPKPARKASKRPTAHTRLEQHKADSRDVAASMAAAQKILDRNISKKAAPVDVNKPKEDPEGDADYFRQIARRNQTEALGGDDPAWGGTPR